MKLSLNTVIVVLLFFNIQLPADIWHDVRTTGATIWTEHKPALCISLGIVCTAALAYRYAGSPVQKKDTEKENAVTTLHNPEKQSSSPAHNQPPLLVAQKSLGEVASDHSIPHRAIHHDDTLPSGTTLSVNNPYGRIGIMGGGLQNRIVIKAVKRTACAAAWYNTIIRRETNNDIYFLKTELEAQNPQLCSCSDESQFFRTNAQGRRYHVCSIDYLVSVPEQTHYKTWTEHGDVSIANCCSGTIQCMNGSIRVIKCTDVHASTKYGTIEVCNCQGVNATTNHGAIMVHACFGAQATTEQGDIIVQKTPIISGLYSSQGIITIDGKRVDNDCSNIPDAPVSAPTEDQSTQGDISVEELVGESDPNPA